MSNVTPFFITGSNAKLVVNGMTIGMATDVSYRVDVKHAEPHVLGVYEAMEIQPLQYEVHGSFTIIRYHQKNIKHTINRGANIPGGMRGDQGDDHNGIGTWTLDKILAQIGMPFGKFANEGRAHQAFDPSKMNKAMAFDIEVRQTIKSGTTRVEQPAPFDITTASQSGQVITGDSYNPTIVPIPAVECTIAFIRNCRLTSTDFKVSKRGTATQTYTFAAQYLDEDTFVADMSGVGQQFS